MSNTLFGFSNFGEASISLQLQANLKMWLDWGLLEAGGFNNATIPSSGQYGGLNHILKSQNDPSYTSGQVWQGFRQDWVWETGVQNATPLNTSGVYVNNTFYPTSTTTGAYAHRIEFPAGRVVFTNAIAPTGKVEANFSYRAVQVNHTDTNKWFNEIQQGTFRSDDSQFSLYGSGDWDRNQNTRTQFPAINIELPVRVRSTPFELGDLINNTYINVVFHVVGESAQDAKKIADMIFAQRDRTIFLFDVNLMASGNAFPLNEYGSRNSGFKTYPHFLNLVADSGYRWKRCRFTNTSMENVGEFGPQLYSYAVRSDLEVLLP